MKNRISKHLKKKDPNDLRTFFLACEYKPGASFWNVLEPFAYDISPAFIYGSLGVLSYKPESYAVVEVHEDCQPLMGYITTITHPDTIELLDRMKVFLGETGFNFHLRQQVDAYTDVDKSTHAWCYVLSSLVLNSYQSIETVEFGLWADDAAQVELLEKIIET